MECRCAYTLAKVTAVLGMQLGVFPVLCGFWLDLCSLELLGSDVDSRRSFLDSAFITCALLHWLVGLVYMLYISLFVSIMREFLRSDVLWFLRNPDDPDYHPFRELVQEPLWMHGRRILLSAIIYSSLIILLVWCPIQICLALLPSLLPINLAFDDPLTDIPANLFLFHICVPFTIEHFKPRAVTKLLLVHWFQFVGGRLGLSTYLFPSSVQDVGNALIAADPLIAQPAVAAVEAAPLVPIEAGRLPIADRNEPIDSTCTDADAGTRTSNAALAQADHCTRLFAVRISVLLLLTWFAVMAGSISCLALPLSTGRRLINALFHVVSVHDAHAYLVGFGILWMSELAFKSASSALYRHRFGPELVREAAGWLLLGLKLLSIATLWLGLIPLLIGLLFELTVWIPLRVPVWQNPVFSLFQDWALGLFYLKIGIRTLMAMPSLAPTWHRKFEQVRPVLCGFA